MHGGFEMLWRGRRHRIDMQRLTGGKSVMVYGQTELTRDLMEARRAADLPTVYEAANVAVHDFDGARPRVSYEKDGARHEIACDFIAGCDGFHGVCRASVPRGRDHRIREGLPVRLARPAVGHAARLARADLRQQPARLLALLDAQPHAQPLLPAGAADREGRGLVRRGVLAGAAPAPRRQGRATRWSPARRSRRASRRCAASSPSRCASAACSWPATRATSCRPTGAKGLNLAATDVKYLSRALIEHYRDGSDAGLDAYSERCLRRVWRAERFSWWFTSLMHRFPDGGPIGAQAAGRRARLPVPLGARRAHGRRELRRPAARLRRRRRRRDHRRPRPLHHRAQGAGGVAQPADRRHHGSVGPAQGLGSEDQRRRDPRDDRDEPARRR